MVSTPAAPNGQSADSQHNAKRNHPPDDEMEAATMKAMEVFIYPDKESLAKAAAKLIADTVRAKPDAVLGLATGSTPVPTYRELARLNREGEISFKQVCTFNLDEYAGMDPQHPQSYRRFMNEQLFNHIDIDPANTHVPSGFADADGAADYDAQIEAAGGVDLQLLGIGHDGHIGFNEPDDTFSRVTHIVDLTEITRQANARFFDSVDEVPTRAVTMGIGTIMRARKILMIVTGADKADTVRAMLQGPVTPRLPASVLALHQNVVVMLDEEAASRL